VPATAGCTAAQPEEDDAISAIMLRVWKYSASNRIALRPPSLPPQAI
jgi:hypothetical protein